MRKYIDRECHHSRILTKVKCYGLLDEDTHHPSDEPLSLLLKFPIWHGCLLLAEVQCRLKDLLHLLVTPLSKLPQPVSAGAVGQIKLRIPSNNWKTKTDGCWNYIVDFAGRLNAGVKGEWIEGWLKLWSFVIAGNTHLLEWQVVLRPVSAC